MAEEDNISLDIEAESSVFSPIINFNSSPSEKTFSGPAEASLPEMENISAFQETQLPESVVNEYQKEEKLPEQINVEIFESMDLPERSINTNSIPDQERPDNVVTAVSDEIKITLPEAQLIENTSNESVKTDLKPEYSEIISNFSVKIDAEAAYEKAKDLEGKVNQLDKNIGALQQPKGNWINTTEKDKYEERPTVEATNLVFDARLKRFASRPIWL